MFDGKVFAIDMGSTWDSFVGIGGQRAWRGQLYSDPRKYQAWLDLYKEALL